MSEIEKFIKWLNGKFEFDEVCFIDCEYGEVWQFKEVINKYERECKNILETMPTVEQKHGHWIVRTIFGNGCREIRCSECCETGFWRNQPLYCPHCGAKMEER